MTFRCPACYYLKTHFTGRLCISCSQVFEEKPNGKIGRKKLATKKKEKKAS